MLRQRCQLDVVGGALVDGLERQAQAAELVGAERGDDQAAGAMERADDDAYQEIAAILEIPLGTVKSRIARGLAQLRQLVLRASPPSGRDPEEMT